MSNYLKIPIATEIHIYILYFVLISIIEIPKTNNNIFIINIILKIIHLNNYIIIYLK